MSPVSLWPILPLSEAFWFQEGPGVRKWQFTKSGIKLLNVGNIEKDGTLNLAKTDRYLDEAEVAKKYSHFLIDEGDLVIASSGISFDDDGLLRTRGAFITSSDLPLCLNTSTIRFKAIEGLSDLHFLRFWLNSYEFRSQITKLVTGSAQQNFGPSHLKALKITLPPLEKQQQVADILDRAEALRAKRRAVLAQFDELIQSIFLSMFGDPIFNPQEFPRIQLMNLCSSADDIKCGPFGTQLGKDEYTTEGVPLWGIKHVNALFKLPTQEFLEAKTAKRLIQYSIEPGDIVMTRKGTIGNCAVYPERYSLGIMHSDLLRLRVNLQSCDPIFLSHQLHYSRDVEQQLALISGGAVMPGINVTKLKSLEVLAPPLDLQKEFTHRIEAIEKLKAAHEVSLAELDELFASIQYRAFRGEL